MSDEPKPEEKKSRDGLKRAVATAAPQLARALGGPLAAPPSPRFPERSSTPMRSTKKRSKPREQLLALKRADHEFQTALRAAQVEEARIDAGDRASARARQQAMNDWTPSAPGALIIVGFFIVMAAMVSHSLPPGMETELSIMLGALATMTAAAVNYFFGSSAGSKEKTRLMTLPSVRRDGEQAHRE